MKFAKMFLIAVVCFVLCNSSFAAVPTLINFQGRLTDSLGNPQDSSYSITFKIYDAPSGGNIVWQETQLSITVTRGIFNVLLGSVTPITDSIFNDTSRWLTFVVGAEPEITPRARLSSSPYAFRVNTVDGASGGTIVGDIQTPGLVYSSAGGFKFPDGSVQTSASPGSFFQNLFRFTAVLSPNATTSFTAPSDKSIYITGVHVHPYLVNPGANLRVSIEGEIIIEIYAFQGYNGTTADGFWMSGGGAPILVRPNEVVTLTQLTGNTSTSILITGFEF